jgi:tetratricopeptide (TPR) repeat protein
MSESSKVRVRIEDRVFPTYLPASPDRNPMFLEKCVYQGSSGKVYPLPFTDRISERPVNRKWKAIWIENEFLRAMVLPELGGRIHVLQDKTNGYDLIYKQPVIKPALVGLAGPWISGGIEFNWPQHHRPATFLPVDYEIENHADGSKTIWCSDHDPMTRMKGMHGVCLRPGYAYLELKVRAYNRTPHVQTFLWWANVATRVHEAYQSFFPPDVYYVADHARRSMSEYPLANGFYYGVNYGERGHKGVARNEIPRQFVPAHYRSTSGDAKIKSQLPDYASNDLSFYANIPTPCSYMCMGSREDFFGGYDYKAQAGIIHIANHHISPGKKQWTWGNHEFGYAWDRHLTDADKNGEYAPYIEIMAGVYTDNQPDFSFLQPGETKTWSQYWYSIQKTGPVQQANLQVAVSLRFVRNGGKLRNMTRLGVAVTKRMRVKIVLSSSRKLFSTVSELTPAKPFVKEIKLPRGIVEKDPLLQVFDSGGNEIISYQPRTRNKGKVPPPATEPPLPEKIAGNDELFITGLHLQQYRHATRCPTLYWREALRRDPLDARCNNAMGLWHLNRGQFNEAEKHFLHAIERLTRRNANPYDGEAYYNLGQSLRYQCQSLPNAKSELSDLRFSRAYDAFYKATWNQGWVAASYHALAEMDCCRQDWTTALEHLNRSLRFNQENLRARNLKVLVLRKLAATERAKVERKNRKAAANTLLRENLALDPLDWWARHLNGEGPKYDLQTAIDLAHDFARAGFYAEGSRLLEKSYELHGIAERKSASPKVALPNRSLGARPLVAYTIGWLFQKEGNDAAAKFHFRSASNLSSDYCFPSRLEDIAVLEAAMHADSGDAKAPYYLGNLLYDRRRHVDAIKIWEKSARLDANFSIVWRNLGIAYFNISRNPDKARAAYERAFRSNPSDARVLYERDQLWKRLGTNPEKRLNELKKYSHLVSQRDDLSVEFCALLNQTRCHIKAMQLLAGRKFQPWEGGEGAAWGQHVRTQLAFGREALFHHDYPCAVSHFENALKSPLNLGEAKHLLANQSNIHFWLGVALEMFRDKKSARELWNIAANFKGDFRDMSVRVFSEMTYYSALSLEKLGQRAKAKKLLSELLAYAKKLQKIEAKIDYFATSLPAMLLFEDDLQFRQETTALFLQAQARLGLGMKSEAKNLLTIVLKRDPNHALAADLWSEYFQPVKV